jgi:putative DeoR family transcriptional regulator (stage III sporulation protein D)
MFEKLEDIKKRYLELESELTKNEVIHNQERYTKLVKEHSSLEDIVSKYDEYTGNERQIEELRAMEQDDDPDIAGMAKDEASGLAQKNRILAEAQYITETCSTVREAAKKFSVSKSTIHKDMVEKLPELSMNLANNVRIVLDINTEERHIRGGQSTKAKYISKN